MFVESFSQGKNNERNEDFFGYNEECFVVADGATDKSGKKYMDKTGGEIISRLAVKEILASPLNGIDLIDFINKKVHELYRELNITNEITDPKLRFSCCVVVARIVGSKLVITCLGDSGFRINGDKFYVETKQVDVDNAKERAKYIQKTGDISGSREYIMPLILKQFEYQNNPNHPLGYGAIDGTSTPSQFIKVFEYRIDTVSTIELFTDGYFVIPKGITIKDWEESFQKGEQEDPDKYIKYLSTKSKDDRTVAIIKLEKLISNFLHN
jgi:serine/threonine protein phosphatase PrpC